MKTNTKTRAKRTTSATTYEPGRGATHGLYPSEQRVVDLYEAGVPNHLIEQLTGMSAKRVRDLIAVYGDVGKSCDSWMTDLREGSMKLLAQITAVHGAGAVMG